MDFLTKDNIELGKGTETRTVSDVIAGLPKEVHPLVKKAYEYEQNGDYENLTKVCQEILKVEPTSKDIQMLLGCKVFLDLWVKVKKDWRNRDNILKDFGFQD